MESLKALHEILELQERSNVVIFCSTKEIYTQETFFCPRNYIFCFCSSLYVSYLDLHVMLLSLSNRMFVVKIDFCEKIWALLHFCGSYSF